MIKSERLARHLKAIQKGQKLKASYLNELVRAANKGNHSVAGPKQQRAIESSQEAATPDTKIDEWYERPDTRQEIIRTITDSNGDTHENAQGVVYVMYTPEGKQMNLYFNSP